MREPGGPVVARRFWIHWRGEGPSGAVLIAEGRLVRLNRVAAAIWERIDDVRDVEELHRLMRRRYRGVTDSILRADVRALIESWMQRGWIVPYADPVFPFPEERGERCEGHGSTRS